VGRAAEHAGVPLPGWLSYGGALVDGACWVAMDRVHGLDLAIQRVEQALDRVRAAWQAEHPDLT
jgi:hypothetical protein